MSEAAPDQSTDAGGTPAEDGGAPFKIPEYLKRGDIALALGVIAILVVLLLPMPTWLLDFSLAISITFSVVILMTVLFIKNPLELNTFPTILLIATMLRLALNLASTRLIWPMATLVQRLPAVLAFGTSSSAAIMSLVLSFSVSGRQFRRHHERCGTDR